MADYRVGEAAGPEGVDGKGVQGDGLTGQD